MKRLDIALITIVALGALRVLDAQSFAVSLPDRMRPVQVFIDTASGATRIAANEFQTAAQGGVKIPRILDVSPTGMTIHASPGVYDLSHDTWIYNVSRDGTWGVGMSDPPGSGSPTVGLLWDLTSSQSPTITGSAPTVTGPSSLNGYCSYPTYMEFFAVSNAGVAVGTANLVLSPLRWDVNNGYQLLGVPTGASFICGAGAAGGVSSDGQIMAGFLQTTDPVFYRHAVVWSQGGTTCDYLPEPQGDLGTGQLGGWSEAGNCSPSGSVITGVALAPVPSILGPSSLLACVWIDRIYHRISGPGADVYASTVYESTDSGWAVGTYGSVTGSGGLLWRAGWAEAVDFESWLTSNYGVTFPWPGLGSGWPTGTVKEVLRVLDDGTNLHFIVDVASPISTLSDRTFYVRVPSGGGTAVELTSDFNDDVHIANLGLTPGSDTLNAVSFDVSGPVDQGPWLGLYSSDPVTTLLPFLLLPPSSAPLRFSPTRTVESRGPFTLPAGITMDVLSLEVLAGGGIARASRVHRFTTP